MRIRDAAALLLVAACVATCAASAYPRSDPVQPRTCIPFILEGDSILVGAYAQPCSGPRVLLHDLDAVRIWRLPSRHRRCTMAGLLDVDRGWLQLVVLACDRAAKRS